MMKDKTFLGWWDFASWHSQLKNQAMEFTNQYIPWQIHRFLRRFCWSRQNLHCPAVLIPTSCSSDKFRRNDRRSICKSNFLFIFNQTNFLLIQCVELILPVQSSILEHRIVPNDSSSPDRTSWSSSICQLPKEIADVRNPIRLKMLIWKLVTHSIINPNYWGLSNNFYPIFW